MVDARRLNPRGFASSGSKRSPLATLAVAVGLLLGGLGVDCGPPPPPAVQPDDVRSIEDFVRCLNPRLAGNPDVEIADTVQCLPPKCTITLTMSDRSAQPACFEGGCQLPRVLLDCPGPPRFMPSYLLCPTGGDDGVNRVEIGEAVDAAGNMRMADIHIVPGPFTAISETGILSVDDSKGCNSNGATCHTAFTDPATNAQHSQRIDPFNGSAGSNGNPDCIIGTDDCRGEAIDVATECFPPDGGSRIVEPESLEKVCQCIQNDSQDVLSYDPNYERMVALCQALLDYQDTRGACTMAGCPQATGPECGHVGVSCDPTTGATIAPESGYHCQPVGAQFQCVADCPCREHELLGGGKYLVNGAVCMVRLELDGLVASAMPDSFEDSADVAGTLSAFDYLTHTLVTSTSITSLEVTRTGADFTATGTGTALVNGDPKNIEFDASQTAGVATFHVREAGSPLLLCGGIGEDQRSAFQLTVNP